LIFGRKIFVTRPGGPKFGIPLALINTYIVWKFQFFVQPFWSYLQKKWKLGLICQKNRWVKIKELAARARCPN